MKDKLWDVTVTLGGKTFVIGQIKGSTHEHALQAAHILYGYTDEGLRSEPLTVTPVPPTAWDKLMEPDE